MPQQTWYELYERLDALALAMAQQWFESDDGIYRTPAYSEFCYILKFSARRRCCRS